MKNQTINVIGFIGLGVMGNSMSKNLLKNKKWSVIVKDLNQSKEEDLQNHGAIIASDIKEVFDKSDVIITCLPGGSYVNEMYFGKQDMISVIKPNKYIVDMSTSQPDLMVKLNINIKKKNSFFADAPIAKTRQAAIDGTLAIMVGSDLNTYKHLLPVFNLIGEDIMHCGDVGSGQLTKIMNNMILFETVVALSEAANIAEKYGMSVEKLFNNITKCSGDSFALKNHGLKSIAKDNFPSPAFSSEYALKDLSYALELGNKLKVKLPGAETAERLLQTSIERGDKDLYFPVIKKYLK
ncbi:NAD(P)-dependent oxidoreductase [Pseudomonadota bacterium]|jgi:hypothetical protein|nr:NAD(P)-dependent oxidoreductase [Pseudomonadota bacterium]|tara:strand:- start:958 stop:1842 length:885 start_codon:yes stop_codon:yes gene_type:complete